MPPYNQNLFILKSKTIMSTESLIHKEAPYPTLEQAPGLSLRYDNMEKMIQSKLETLRKSEFIGTAGSSKACIIINMNSQYDVQKVDISFEYFNALFEDKVSSTPDLTQIIQISAVASEDISRAYQNAKIEAQKAFPQLLQEMDNTKTPEWLQDQLDSLKENRFIGKAGHANAYLQVEMTSQYQTTWTISSDYFKSLFKEVELETLPNESEIRYFGETFAKDLDTAYNQARQKAFIESKEVIEKLMKDMETTLSDNSEE
jgi:hypothetical protein